MLARNTPAAWVTMIAATTSADAGSTQTADGTSRSTTPATTTASDASASPTMCRRTARMLRSFERSRRIRAANPLTTRPSDATTTTMPARTGVGCPSRWTLSMTINTVTTAISDALASAARMVARWLP